MEVRSAADPYYPEMKTPKPKVHGAETAVVVGPAGEEIHTDEFGRCRVQFHWDREGKMNEDSSCWIPVSQPWGVRDAAVRDPDTAEAPTLVGVEALAADHITVEVAGIEPASNVVL